MKAIERSKLLAELAGYASERPVSTLNVVATYGVTQRTAQRILHELEAYRPEIRRVRPLSPYTVSGVSQGPRPISVSENHA